MPKIALISLTILFVAFLSGCAEDADSEDIRTSGLYASMDITASADNLVDIKTSLKVGGSNSNTYLNLTSGDTLKATLNDSETTTLSKSEQTGGEIYYIGSFSSSVAGAEDSTIKIAFERSAADVSAPNSFVALPAIPTGLTADKTSFDRNAESLMLTWDPLNLSNLSLEYEGDCIENGSNTVIDNGTYTINAGMIKDNNQNNCQVTFTLIRSVTGTLDPAYGEGGYIKAKQSRSHAVTSTP